MHHRTCLQHPKAALSPSVTSFYEVLPSPLSGACCVRERRPKTRARLTLTLTLTPDPGPAALCIPPVPFPGVAKPPGWSVMPEGEAPEDLRDGATLATGADAVVGPWSMHAVEVNSSRKRPSRLDYLALPTDGQYDYILQVS